MKIRLSLLACALVTLAIVAPVLAQDPPATLTLSGTVTSSSPTSLVIQADDGSQKTFVVDTRSTIPSSLARGAAVTITYEASGDQMRVVSVSPSAVPPPTRTGTEATGTDRLPATASPLPLIGLLGVIGVASGLALRRHLA